MVTRRRRHEQAEPPSDELEGRDAASSPDQRGVAGDQSDRRPREGRDYIIHPKSPDASLETYRKLAGSITLSGPVPSRKFLDESDE